MGFCITRQEARCPTQGVNGRLALGMQGVTKDLPGLSRKRECLYQDFGLGFHLRRPSLVQQGNQSVQDLDRNFSLTQKNLLSSIPKWNPTRQQLSRKQYLSHLSPGVP